MPSFSLTRSLCECIFYLALSIHLSSCLSPSYNHPFRATLEGHPLPRTACPRTRPGVAVTSRAASARASLAIVGPRVRKTGVVLVVVARMDVFASRSERLSRDLVHNRKEARRSSEEDRDEAPEEGCSESFDDRIKDRPSRSRDSKRV